MSDIKKVLTDEIRRLAKKEIKTSVEPLAAKVATLKKLVSTQAKEIELLKSRVPEPAKVSQVEETPKNDKGVRLNAVGIKRIRAKLNVSQSIFAKLVGANILSVSHWELGKTEPRNEFKSRIAVLRRIGKRELEKRLTEIASAKISEKHNVKETEKR